VTGRGLPGGDADLRALEAVVDGVADDVDERIGDGLDDGLVDLRPLARELELDLLALLLGEVADEPQPCGRSSPRPGSSA
jgi:hypothetical protein